MNDLIKKVSIIEKAKNQGFDLPFLLNTSSYVKADTIRMPGMLIQAKLITKYLHDRYGDNILYKPDESVYSKW